MEHPYHLRYDAPAEAWHEAMPLGNGRLGAMAYGHAGIERIQLNDDSLWYGAFHDRNNASLREKLPEIQKLVLAGDIRHAEELILQYMAGTPAQHAPLYDAWRAGHRAQPAPTLHDGLDAGERRRRGLLLRPGFDDRVLSIGFEMAGVRYRREMFISHPAQAMCIRLTCDQRRGRSTWTSC